MRTGVRRQVVTGDARQPERSPDGRRLFFTLYSPRSDVDLFDLFSVAPDGSDMRRLLHQPDNDHEPELSPGGGRLAFQSSGVVRVAELSTGEEQHAFDGLVSDWAVAAGQADGVRPFFECVVRRNGRSYGRFGYDNPGLRLEGVAIGQRNRFLVDEPDQGQPTGFLPGRHSAAVEAPLAVLGVAAAWQLDGRVAVATPVARAC